jgi:hypothetical protein
MGVVVRPQNDCHLIHVCYKNEPVGTLSLKEQVQRSGNGERKRAPSHWEHFNIEAETP